MAATSRSAGRIFAIGDVHGCIDELQALFARLRPQPLDRFIFLGDLVNRGPDSQAVIRLVRGLRNCRCLLGNHEVRLLKFRETGEIDLLKDYDWDTLRTLEEDDWTFLENLDVSLGIPRLQTAFVHGGLLPDQPWDEQGAEVVCEIQSYDPATGAWGRRSDLPSAGSWQDRWVGPPFVICGHTPRPEIHRRPWSIGIDTGCVYGGKLTALEIQSLEVIQQPALRNYAGKELRES